MEKEMSETSFRIHEELFSVFLDESDKKSPFIRHEDADAVKTNVESMTDKEYIENVIEELGLSDPKKLLEFVIDTHLALFDGIMNDLGEIKELDLKNTIASEETALDHFKLALEDNDEKEMDKAKDILMVVWRQLKNKIEIYINSIRKIDSHANNRWKYYIFAHSDFKKLEVNNRLLKIASDELLKTMAILKGVSIHLGRQMDAVFDPFETFIDNTMTENTCGLLVDYDKDRNDGYWESYRRKAKKINSVKVLTTE